MKKNKQLLVNMIASLATLAINLIIGFCFTPIVVNKAGGEAYGFVSLSNSMINYITIFTIALNSVAGRFITIKIHQNKIKEANEYFISVLVANIIISLILITFGVPIIMFLDKIINIPVYLVKSTKILFFLVLFNFIISILGTVFTVATFITNKLYLSNIINVICSLVRIAILYLSFKYISTNIIFFGVSSFVSSIVAIIFNIYLTLKLIPNIKINKKFFNVKKIVELVSSGIWNSITKIAQVLSDGLDLLVTNLWVSTYAMGQLSLAKIVSSYMSMLISNIISLFSPQLTKYYAKGDINSLVKELKLSMKISSFFSNIPFCFVMVYSGIFFELWVPSQNSHVLHVLTILSVQAVIVSGAITALNNVFVITNNLKVNSIFWIIISFIDVGLVAFLLKFTNLGVYAVAGVSTFVGIIANLIFVPLYACHCLKVKWNTFYGQILRYTTTTILILFIVYIFNKITNFPVKWIWLFVDGIISCIISITINYFILLDSNERLYLFNIIKRKFFRRKI